MCIELIVEQTTCFVDSVFGSSVSVESNSIPAIQKYHEEVNFSRAFRREW